MLRQAVPRTEVARYTFAGHQRRHYEKMPDFPQGLTVLGDAHCSFNPVYGQGITAAALSVQELEMALQQGPMHAQNLQARIARAVDAPWLMSTGEDFRYPEVEGNRPFLHGLMQWFTGQVHVASQYDPVVAGQFYRAMHMLDGPTAFLNPGFLYRVFLRPPPMPAIPAQVRG